MSVKQFRLPDPGEGLTEAELVTWRVAVGDTVKVNDIVVEIETAKSLVELPVPFAGIVTELLAREGETVEVGMPIISVDTSGGEPEIEEGKIGGTTSTGRTAVLVGYGVKQTEAKRRPRKALPSTDAESSGMPQPSTPPPAAPERFPQNNPDEFVPSKGVAVGDRTARAHRSRQPGAGRVPGSGRVLAKPPVRKLAKDLGVDLDQVAASGDGGVITRSDVEQHGDRRGGADGIPAAAVAAGGLETRVPVKGVRRMTAQAMVQSAFTAPHVTEWVTVDVTRTMELVARLKDDREFRGVKVTPLTVLAKALCLAIARNPGMNATWDEAAQEIVVKGYVNLGIAAATPRGLLVPNVKDAQEMTMRQLAEAIGALTATAREGRTQPAEMSGGTITITNVGVFGVDSGTPIINPGESAIVCFGAIRKKPWVVTNAAGDDEIEIRHVTQLAVSFDHRLIDGELGSRFLNDLAAILDDPARALVWA